MRESLKKAQKKYARNKRKSYQIAFNREKDRELIDYFEKIENKSKFVKDKIKEEIRRVD